MRSEIIARITHTYWEEIAWVTSSTKLLIKMELGFQADSNHGKSHQLTLSIQWKSDRGPRTANIYKVHIPYNWKWFPINSRRVLACTISQAQADLWKDVLVIRRPSVSLWQMYISWFCNRLSRSNLLDLVERCVQAIRYMHELSAESNVPEWNWIAPSQTGIRALKVLYCRIWSYCHHSLFFATPAFPPWHNIHLQLCGRSSGERQEQNTRTTQIFSGKQ